MDTQELVNTIADDFHDWIDGDEWVKEVHAENDHSLVATFTNDYETELETGRFRITITPA